jgi:hypothetical protein
MQIPLSKTHPAAEWAAEQNFSSVEVDCTTTVVLKILDNKCKMLPGEKAAIMEIYDVVRTVPGALFDAAAHQSIDQARQQADASVLERIHQLRVYAEQKIPKPVMKKYKARLREGLFG